VRKKTIAALAAAGTIAMTAPAAMASPLPQGVTGPQPGPGIRTLKTLNWAGYVSTGHKGGYFSVLADWTVPDLTCTSVTTGIGFWVGLNGAPGIGKASGNVEQGGIQASCGNRHASYYAWTEAYPFQPVARQVRHRVEARDRIQAYVIFQGSNAYTIVVSDLTRGWNYSTTWYLRQVPRSAEVVSEPFYASKHVGPIPDFGGMRFSGVLTDVAVKWTERYVLTGGNKVRVGPLTDHDEDFTETWLRSS
jgi:Peptidase A4 family